MADTQPVVVSGSKVQHLASPGDSETLCGYVHTGSISSRIKVAKKPVCRRCARAIRNLEAGETGPFDHTGSVV